MPEAAMDENYGLPFGQDNIGFAGKVARMKPETKAQRMKGATNGEFRLGVL